MSAFIVCNDIVVMLGSLGSFDEVEGKLTQCYNEKGTDRGKAVYEKCLCMCVNE